MIKNAQVVRDNTNPNQYNVETAQRGSKELVVRAHILQEILRNAQRWVRGYESPESAAKEYGSLFDCLLLTPTQWPDRYAVIPVDAPKKPTKAQLNAKKPSPETLYAIEWWENFVADNPGEIVTQKLNASVHAAISRLREDEKNAELVDCSKHAVMVVAEWHDPGSELVVPLKCLIDIVPPGDHPVYGLGLWDTKSSRNASPRSFGQDAQKFRYDIQGALYLDLWNAASGENREDFGHVVQENFPPYEYRTPPPLMSRRFLQFGKLSYQAALAVYCKALASGIWPSYDVPPKWPITDCADWFLNFESIYPPTNADDLDDEPEESETPAEEPVDLVP